MVPVISIPRFHEVEIRNLLKPLSHDTIRWNCLSKVATNKPGIWSCDLVSSAQTCASARSVARPSSVHGPHKPVCHSVLYHSCHPRPTMKRAEDYWNKLTMFICTQSNRHNKGLKKKIHTIHWDQPFVHPRVFQSWQSRIPLISRSRQS